MTKCFKLIAFYHIYRYCNIKMILKYSTNYQLSHTPIEFCNDYFCNAFLFSSTYFSFKILLLFLMFLYKALLLKRIITFQILSSTSTSVIVLNNVGLFLVLVISQYQQANKYKLIYVIHTIHYTLYINKILLNLTNCSLQVDAVLLYPLCDL